MSGSAYDFNDPGLFYTHFRNFISYFYLLRMRQVYMFMKQPENLSSVEQSLEEFLPRHVAGFEYLKASVDGFWHEIPPGGYVDPGSDIPPTQEMLDRFEGPIHDLIVELYGAEYTDADRKDFSDYIIDWRMEYVHYMRFGPNEEQQKCDIHAFDQEIARAAQEYNQKKCVVKPPPKTRAGTRPQPKELFSVHSSAPVYDIGETIARGLFSLQKGGNFPTASIIGGTQGRIELLPFWDHKNNRPLTPQSVNLAANNDQSEFFHMQEEAIRIATSYNEEMATYFYAMDAYWLTHAKNPEDFVELDIANLLQYTGKKPVKSHGKYTGSYRPDQLQRAGMMVYGMGFSMVELDRAVIKGVGERTHYKRLWDVSDMYMMTTLDDENYIESLTYRPNEFFRNASFGSRRETALLMSKVLSLDYSKMVVARRLGRYYTWLWRDRAYAGNIAAPISCARLLERAGIEVEKGKERYARRSLESALDRLEVEGIISQWVLVDRDGQPVDTAGRISFPRWCEMKISVSPPDVILDHYAANLAASPAQQAAIAGHTGGKNGLDIQRIKEIRKEQGYTLAMLSEETGVELSTLSRILAGKTKRPGADHIKAINAWLSKFS